MLGQMIGITTSIATMAAIGVTRGAVNVATGAVRRRAPARRVIVRQNADVAISKLIAALEAERMMRAQLEKENARLRERASVAEEAFDFLMQERAGGSTR